MIENKLLSDPNGNRTEMVTSEGTTTYTYTANNQLASLIAPSGTTTYQYNALGNQILVTYPNGTYTEYTYHPTRNWVTAVVNKNSGGTVISSFDYYTYDNVGNRLSVTELDGSTVTYTYNDIYELESETRTGSNAYAISYSYDNVGNRLQKTEIRGQTTETAYTYNANNQLLVEIIGGDTVINYSYDDNGNLLLKTDGANTTTFIWDWRNMLTQVTSSQSPVTSYEYDGDGNRISKTAAGIETKYINDVGLPLVQVLMETNESDTVLATYTYGNDLVSMNSAGVSSYYQYDGLGSTRQLTDSAGAVVASYTYEAFGNLIASSGATTNAYGFTGEQQFGEADNLLFLRARYYDARVGRFISRDPLLEPMKIGNNFIWPLPYLINQPQHLHSYIYCQNNPVNHTDPKGLGKCGDQFEIDKANCGLEFNICKQIICRWKALGDFYKCVIDCFFDPDCQAA